MSDRFVIDVARLDPDGETLDGEVDSAALDFTDPYVRPVGPTGYRVEARRFGTELLVRGSLSQDFEAACSRCGEDFPFGVSVPDFAVSVKTDEKTEFADLTADLRESILLALPTYPVCRADCRGRCPTCGKNLNDGDCTCAGGVSDDRWAALDAVCPVGGGKQERE